MLWVVKGLGPGGAERLLAAAARPTTAERVQIECAYVLPYKDHLVAALECGRGALHLPVGAATVTLGGPRRCDASFGTAVRRRPRALTGARVGGASGRPQHAEATRGLR